MTELRVDALPGLQPVEVAHGHGLVMLILPETAVHQPAMTALTWKRARELAELLIEQARYAEQALGGTDERAGSRKHPGTDLPSLWLAAMGVRVARRGLHAPGTVRSVRRIPSRRHRPGLEVSTLQRSRGREAGLSGE